MLKKEFELAMFTSGADVVVVEVVVVVVVVFVVVVGGCMGR